MALTPQEELDLIAIEKERRRRAQAKPAAEQPRRLGAEGGLLAGQVPGRPVPGLGVTADAIAEVGLPTAAQIAAAPLGPKAMAGAGGIAAGVGNSVAQIRRMLTGEQTGFNIGEAVAMTGMGAMPVGGPGAIANSFGAKRAAAAGLGTAIQTGAGAGVAEQMRSIIDEGRLPSDKQLAIAAALPAAAGGVAGTAQATGGLSAIKDSIRNAIIRKQIQAGGAVPPSMVEPTMGNRLGDWVGNRANIAREAAVANEAVGTAQAKRQAGIAPGRDLSKEAIQDSFDRLSREYYEPIRNRGQVYAEKLEAYKNRKVDLDDARAVKERDRTEESKAALKDAKAAYDMAAGGLENLIGKGGFARLKEGETKWAKTVDVRDSSNLASGSLDPAKLAKRDDLTGELKDAADFNQAVGGTISKESTKIQSPIVGRLFSGIGGGIGYSAGGAPGLAAGVAAPILIEEAVRRYQLSRMVQNRLAQPRLEYSPSGGDETFRRIAAILGAQASNSNEGR